MGKDVAKNPEPVSKSIEKWYAASASSPGSEGDASIYGEPGEETQPLLDPQERVENPRQEGTSVTPSNSDDLESDDNSPFEDESAGLRVSRSNITQSDNLG
jgi:hypothetical protein